MKNILVARRLNSGSGLELTLIPQNFQNIRVAWLDKYSSFTCFMNLPFRVSMALNWWKVEIISYPSKYLLLILEFYQRSFPLFLYGFQCGCYLWDIPIANTYYLVAAVQGVWVPWMKDITYLRISSWLIVTRRQKCDCRVFARPRLGEFNDENP